MSSSDISAVTNLIPTVNEGFSTTVAVPGATSGGTTVPLTSVSGLTNGTVFVGIVEPGLTNEQTFTGTVDTSGSQITGVKWTRGTNTAHAAGVSIVDYTTGTGFNMLAKAISNHTDQDGTLKAGAVDVTAVLADNIITAAKLQSDSVTTAKILDDAVTAPKVVGLDKANMTTDSNPYKFSAYRSGAWNVVSGYAKIPFESETYDTNNNFDTTLSRYIAPVDGFYHFSSTAGMVPGAGDGYGINIYKNGSLIKTGGTWVVYYSFNTAFTVSADIPLTAGDYVEIYSYNGSGSSKFGDVGAPYVFFDGHLVSRT